MIIHQVYTEINKVLSTTEITRDYGLKTILSGIEAAQGPQFAATLAQDLSVALTRRGYPEIGARVALATWNVTGSLGTLNIVKTFMLANLSRLKSDLSNFIKTFADIIKGADQQRLLHKMNTDELFVLFALVERLGACSALNDMNLLDELVKKVEEETERAEYSVIKKFLEIYQEISTEEDLERICHLRRVLYDRFSTMTNLNRDTAPVIDYLISVSHARRYVAVHGHKIARALNRCSICSRYYDDEESNDPWVSDILEPLAIDCAFCKDRPVIDMLQDFVSSVKQNLSKYGFLPSARLFGDVHEMCNLGYWTRSKIAEETAPQKDVFKSAHKKWLHLDSDLIEKT